MDRGSSGVGYCRPGLFVIHVDHASKTPGMFGGVGRLGVQIQNDCFCLDQTQHKNAVFVLGHGILDPLQRGDLRVGSPGEAKKTIGGGSFGDPFGNRQAQQKTRGNPRSDREVGGRSSPY